MGFSKLFGAAVVGVAVLIGVSNMQPHNEDALLSDWSAPPPWPIFIGLNVIAGGLRAAEGPLSAAEIAAKVPGGEKVKVSARSTLVLDGAGIELHDVEVRLGLRRAATCVPLTVHSRAQVDGAWRRTSRSSGSPATALKVESML